MRKRIISKLDIKDNNLVKGIQLEGLRVLGDPNQFAKDYYLSGIDEIFVQDVIASLYQKKSITKFLKNFSKDVFIPICVGGGINNLNDVTTLMIEGADKISLNSYALKNPSFIDELVKNFGSSTICINIEVKLINNTFKLFVNNGRDPIDKNLIDWISEIQDRGAGEIHLVSIDNDGMEKGVDINLLNFVKSLDINVPLIYSGGFNLNKDKNLLNKIGENLDGIAIGSYFHMQSKHLIRDSLWFRETSSDNNSLTIKDIINNIRKDF